MGITKFLYLLLIFATILIFYDVDQVDTKKEEQEKPLVSFYDSVMYNINTKEVKSIIPAKEAYMYDTREEMVDGTIVTRDKNSIDKNNTNSISANNMTKIEDDVYLDGNVNLETAKGFQLKTEQLQYNLKTKIVQNEQQFVVVKGFHDMYGKNLYYDPNKEELKAKYTHFNIKVENE